LCWRRAIIRLQYIARLCQGSDVRGVNGEEGLVSRFRIAIGAVAALFFGALGIVYAIQDPAQADLPGPDECRSTNPRVFSVFADYPGQSGDAVSFKAPDDFIVAAACINASEGSFAATDNHSDPLGDGTYEDGCFTISGVDTQSVSVSRNAVPGDRCGDIQHVDFLIVRR